MSNLFYLFYSGSGQSKFGTLISFLFPLLLASTEACHDEGIVELQTKSKHSHIDFTSNAVYVSDFDFLYKYPTFKHSKTNKKTHNGSAKK